MSGSRAAGAPASAYTGRRVALLTQHGKERVIAPVLDAVLGVGVERVDGADRRPAWAGRRAIMDQVSIESLQERVWRGRWWVWSWAATASGIPADRVSAVPGRYAFQSDSR